MNKTHQIISLAALLSLMPAAMAEIPKSFIHELREAKKSLESKTPVAVASSSDKIEDPFKEYASLVDKSYSLLENELKILSKKKANDKSLQSLFDNFLESASLSLSLDPGLSVGELLVELKQINSQAFEKALNKLAPSLKQQVSHTLDLEKQTRDQGNGN